MEAIVWVINFYESFLRGGKTNLGSIEMMSAISSGTILVMFFNHLSLLLLTVFVKEL